MSLSLAGDGTLTGVDPALSGFGKTLQVVQTVKTDTQVSSTASGATATISGLSVTITPTASASKVLLILSLSMNWQGASNGSINILRNGTPIQVGDANGSRSQMTAGGSSDDATRVISAVSVTVLDNPATTSAVTYTVETRNAETATRVLYINRPELDDNAAYNSATSSSLIAIEVAA